MKSILSTILMVFVFSCSSGTANKENIKENSSSINLEDLEGNNIQINSKITILNLWATWCKPCIAEMPALKAMQQKLPNDIKLLVASNEPLERQLKFIEKQNINLPFVQLKSNLESLGVYALPTTLILNEDGEILETLVGVHEWNSAEQIDRITSYLK